MQQAAAAMLAESGGHASHLTRKLASAGFCGKHPQNCQRDVTRALELPLATRPDNRPKYVSSYLWILKASRPRQTDHDLLQAPR